MSATNPPKPPPRQIKSDQSPFNYLNHYKKDNKGHYWFQRVPEEKLNSSQKDVWIQLVQKTIVDYGSYMVENQIFDKAETDKLEEYIKTASEFIEAN